MADQTPIASDLAAPILAGDPALSDEHRADLWDAFHGSKHPDELAQQLQPLAASDETKQQLVAAKKQSMPAIAPVDKISAVMTKMTQMDPQTLALAEAHPNVFKILAAAANPPEKESESASGASKPSPKGNTSKDGNNAAAPTPDVPATPPGHALVQGIDGGLHHIPHANLDKARAIDPQLQILHVEP